MSTQAGTYIDKLKAELRAAHEEKAQLLKEIAHLRDENIRVRQEIEGLLNGSRYRKRTSQ